MTSMKRVTSQGQFFCLLVRTPSQSAQEVGMEGQLNACQTWKPQVKMQQNQGIRHLYTQPLDAARQEHVSSTTGRMHTDILSHSLALPTLLAYTDAS